MNSITKSKWSVAATIINHKIRFSAVCLSSPIRLTGKFAFVLFPFYSNQCKLLGGHPLGGIPENPVGISLLVEAGFVWSRFKI